MARDGKRAHYTDEKGKPAGFTAASDKKIKQLAEQGRLSKVTRLRGRGA